MNTVSPATQIMSELQANCPRCLSFLSLEAATVGSILVCGKCQKKIRVTLDVIKEAVEFQKTSDRFIAQVMTSDGANDAVQPMTTDRPRTDESAYESELAQLRKSSTSQMDGPISRAIFSIWGFFAALPIGVFIVYLICIFKDTPKFIEDREFFFSAGAAFGAFSWLFGFAIYFGEGRETRCPACRKHFARCVRGSWTDKGDDVKRTEKKYDKVYIGKNRHLTSLPDAYVERSEHVTRTQYWHTSSCICKFCLHEWRHHEMSEH